MNSSRTTTIGIMLILLVFFGWMMFNQPKPTPPSAPSKTALKDSLSSAAAASAPEAPKPDASAIVKTDPALPVVTSKIETPLVFAEFSSKGGTISSWVLKSYKRIQDKTNIDLIDRNKQAGDAHLRFVAGDGKIVSTRDLNFNYVGEIPTSIAENDTVRIVLSAPIDSTASIEKTLTLTGNNYLIGIQYVLRGMQSKLTGYRYTLETTNPLPYTEESPDMESTSTRAFAVLPGGAEEIDASTVGEDQHQSFNGEVNFVAARTQYFLQSLEPITPRPQTSDISGTAKSLPGGFHYESYTLGLQIPIVNANNDTIRANYYLGPLEYSRLSEMSDGKLTETMDFGWSFLVRPIAIYILYPILMFLHTFISNWGVVIIVFSVIAKLLTYPLSTGQMKSMRKMQAIMPEVSKIKEQYPNDPKKVQEETFKTYRMYGVNPAGGCLPLLLQMPILFALYSVLVNVIELRQAPFTLWITDLSVPDRLIDFGSTAIPLLGNHLSGLTVLMTITMIIQQVFTVTDERQKKMAYIMPILFMFLFNNLPSGVALYYFMFNIFGIMQQVYNKKFLPPLSLEQLKEDAKNKKGGGLMARMQDAEKNARAQRQKAMLGNQPQGKKKKK